MSTPEQLWRRYLLAICLIAIAISITHTASVRTVIDQEVFAEQINLSGRQRMLSQRILYFAATSVHDPSIAQDPRFTAAIDEFANAHETLFGHRPGEHASERGKSHHIVGNYIDLAELDRLVARFIALARLADDETRPDGERARAVSEMEMVGPEILLSRLNSATGAFESHAQSINARTTTVMTASYVIALLLLMGELLLIFKPAHRLVETQIEQLTKTNAALIESEQAAASAMRTKSDFLANMSHELRTPMHGILGISELLLQSDINNQHKQYAETIHQSTNDLLTVINDILDFSKIEAGKMSIVAETFDMEAMIDGVIEVLSFKAREKNIELVHYYPPHAPKAFVGDQARLRQVFFNIIGNAVKFTDEGLVTVVFNVEPMPRGYKISVSIVDTGVGIAPDKRDKIFRSFEQLDSTATRKYEGTGLGLAIAKRIVDLMGGSIDVDSTLGEGSTFILTLTLPLGDESEIRRPLKIQSTDGMPRRVLVVDDVALNRRILKEQLEACGDHVVEADGASTTLEILETGDEAKFDLAIIDYQMPGMDGLDLARLLRARASTQATPVVILTSLSGIESDERLAEISRIKVATKPISASKIGDVLNGRPVSSAARFNTPQPNRQALPAARTGERDTAPDPLGKKLRIMIVDDSPTNRLFLSRGLQNYDCDIRMAKDGKEAVDLYCTFLPDLTLMDWSMPVMNGLEATRIIRDFEKDNQREPAAIIGLSANALQEQKQKSLDAGMTDYLAKPISLRQLIEKLETVLGAPLRLRDAA